MVEGSGAARGGSRGRSRGRDAALLGGARRRRRLVAAQVDDHVLPVLALTRMAPVERWRMRSRGHNQQAAPLTTTVNRHVPVAYHWEHVCLIMAGVRTKKFSPWCLISALPTLAQVRASPGCLSSRSAQACSQHATLAGAHLGRLGCALPLGRRRAGRGSLGLRRSFAFGLRLGRRLAALCPLLRAARSISGLQAGAGQRSGQQAGKGRCTLNEQGDSRQTKLHARHTFAGPSLLRLSSPPAHTVSVTFPRLHLRQPSPLGCT